MPARALSTVAPRPLVSDEAQAVPIGVIRRRAADEDGAGGAADQTVGAVAADEDVAPTAAVEVIVPGTADQHVVARGPLEPIVARTAVQLTGEGERAGELDVVVAFETVDHDAARRMEDPERLVVEADFDVAGVLGAAGGRDPDLVVAARPHDDQLGLRRIADVGLHHHGADQDLLTDRADT